MAATEELIQVSVLKAAGLPHPNHLPIPPKLGGGRQPGMRGVDWQ